MRSRVRRVRAATDLGRVRGRGRRGAIGGRGDRSVLGRGGAVVVVVVVVSKRQHQTHRVHSGHGYGRGRAVRRPHLPRGDTGASGRRSRALLVRGERASRRAAPLPSSERRRSRRRVRRRPISERRRRPTTRSASDRALLSALGRLRADPERRGDVRSGRSDGGARVSLLRDGPALDRRRRRRVRSGGPAVARGHAVRLPEGRPGVVPTTARVRSSACTWRPTTRRGWSARWCGWRRPTRPWRCRPPRAASGVWHVWERCT